MSFAASILVVVIDRLRVSENAAFVHRKGFKTSTVFTSRYFTNAKKKCLYSVMHLFSVHFRALGELR